MTLLEHRPPLPVAGLGPARPTLADIVARVSKNLLIACVVPAILFFVCFESYGVWPAILLATTWSYGVLGYRAVTGARTSGLLCLTALAMTARALIALAAHSAVVYFLQPIIVDATVAMVFLLSLATARPMVARLAGDAYPVDAELAQRPAIGRLFRNLTALWAGVCLAKAVSMLYVLHSQSLGTFVVVKSIAMPATNLLTVVLTIVLAALVARTEGLIGVRPRALPTLPGRDVEVLVAPRV